MKNREAMKKTLLITVIYLVFGCAWIVFSDQFLHFTFPDNSKAYLYSIIKGLIYVAITATLFYSLTYPAMKKIFKGNKELIKLNDELIKTNEMYKSLYQEYSHKQALLKSLIDSVPDLIFYKDINGAYMGCNQAFKNFVGKSEDEIIGKIDTDIFPETLSALFITMDWEVLETGSLSKTEFKVNSPDGNSIYLEILKTPYFDNEGKLIGLIGISRDITVHKEREEKIRYVSYHDNMTGLFNRTYFDEVKDTLDKPENLPLSVIIGDVNGMKMINDAFGHVKGDKVLEIIAGILQKCVRKEDIVARTGGDEFSILLPKADSNTAKEIADKIREQCNQKREDENNEIYLDIALGYATKLYPEESLDKILLLAEDLMYRRKLLGQKSLRNDYLTYIKTTMFEKSNETEEHAERLVKLSRALGEEMGLTENQLDELELVAMLHDIGKISIDKNILTKTDKLTDEELREIKKHPEVGYRICNSTSGLSHIAEYILCHHEYWNGCGYPLGLSRSDIPLISRIVSVVDAYDAMTKDRAYRKAMSHTEAVEEIIRNKGTQFDPEIADIFINRVLPKQDIAGH